MPYQTYHARYWKKYAFLKAVAVKKLSIPSEIFSIEDIFGC